MLARWRDRASYSIEEVMTQTGQKYFDFYEQKNGLPFAEKDDFITSLNMNEKVLTGYTSEDLRDLLIKHGPLWVTSDSDQTKGFSPFAVIVAGMTTDLDLLELIDPATGKKTSDSFENFISFFSDVVVEGEVQIYPRLQIIHLKEEISHN